MPRHTIDIQIAPGITPVVDRRWLRSVVVDTLRAQGLDGPVEMSLTLTTEEEVRRLNRRYRNIDAATDVLSFGMAAGKSGNDAFPGEPDVQSLGDVVLSYPRAVQQAVGYGHSIEREVAFLTVHGILHLLGYDHQNPKDEASMFARQEEILIAMGLIRELAPWAPPSKRWTRSR